MTSVLRVKFGLLTIGVLLTASLAWSAAQGQFRPPQPPGFRPPGLNPGMPPPGGMGGGGIGIGWRCPKCGQTGAGMIPPATCPGCGMRFVNGVGKGSEGGLIGNPHGGPAMNPNPPLFDPMPQPNGNGIAPGFNPPNNFPPIVDSPNPSMPDANNSSLGESNSSSRRWLIALVIGIIVVGVFALLGGVGLVIFSLRSNNSSSDPRHRDDYDD